MWRRRKDMLLDEFRHVIGCLSTDISALEAALAQHNICTKRQAS